LTSCHLLPLSRFGLEPAEIVLLETNTSLLFTTMTTKRLGISNS
jgi:hypothetical protein